MAWGLLLVCLLGMTGVATSQQNFIPTEAPIFTCQPITEITVCENVMYANASFPNFRNQMTQTEANAELNNFIPLIRLNCSGAIVHMLCAVYAPFCEATFLDLRGRIRPCKNLCEFVRSGCEDDLQDFGLSWPPHLQCDDLPSRGPNVVCFGPPDPSTLTIPPIDNVVITGPNTNDTPTIEPPRAQAMCPANQQVPPTLVNKSYSFADISNCGVGCSGIYFSENERDTVAPAFILLFAILCVLFTLFTVATFLIDRRRFHYPERPIIFLSFCYLIISLAYIVGAISKLVGGSNSSFACTEPPESSPVQSLSFVFQRLPNDDTSYRSASCVILFVLVYYFQMASAIWWVILTLTWFLAASLKWGEEAVERLWLLYHMVAWSVPAIQVILVLALRLVDGDQLSGVCYTGNFHTVSLGVFVFFFLASYLLVGLVFLVIGFAALVNIRRQLQRDPVKSRKLTRLIMRIGIYSALYVIPNLILLLLYIYEISERDDWEQDVICPERDPTACTTRPSFGAFLLRYIMLFTVGICSTAWILSQKTFNAWQKFFSSCGCRTQSYDMPMHAKPMHVKPMNPHQTAV